MRIKTLFLIVSFMLICYPALLAQNIALKSNLLYDATATINLGVEFNLSEKWTLGINGNYNAWVFENNKKWKQASLQPELRYWICEDFNKHFLSLHLIGGLYNFGGIKNDFEFLGINYFMLSKYRYEGWIFGGGLGYGYSWMLSGHWNLEAELGLGYLYAPNSSKFKCEKCGDFIDKKNRYLPTLTKLAINLVYIF